MKYRKKPVVVEALQWKGNNVKEMISFMDNGACNYNIGTNVPIKIETLEGVKEELYPCRKDIFEEICEIVE